MGFCVSVIIFLCMYKTLFHIVWRNVTSATPVSIDIELVRLRFPSRETEHSYAFIPQHTITVTSVQGVQRDSSGSIYGHCMHRKSDVVDFHLFYWGSVMSHKGLAVASADLQRPYSNFGERKMCLRGWKIELRLEKVQQLTQMAI